MTRESLQQIEKFIADELATRRASFLPDPLPDEAKQIADAEAVLEIAREALRDSEAGAVAESSPTSAADERACDTGVRRAPDNSAEAQPQSRVYASPGSAADTPPCMGCGGPHRFDTTIPSVAWNAVIRSKGLPEYLCASCIVREFARAGQGFTATLWSGEFDGVAVEFIVGSMIARDAALVSQENTALRAQLSQPPACTRCAEVGKLAVAVRVWMNCISEHIPSPSKSIAIAALWNDGNDYASDGELSVGHLRALLAAIHPPEPALEQRVAEWVRTRIGPEHMQSRERAMRLLEEAFELAQAEGITAEMAVKQAAHVYARPVGEPKQEAAGVAVCLLGWLAATGNTFRGVALAEIERIEAKPIAQIRGSLARKADADLVITVQPPEPAMGQGTAKGEERPCERKCFGCDETTEIYCENCKRPTCTEHEELGVWEDAVICVECGPALRVEDPSLGTAISADAGEEPNP